VPEAALGAVRDTLREHGEPIAAGAMTFMQARTANEVLKAQERRLRLQQMKGELVDRAKAVAQVFRLARDERDAYCARGEVENRIKEQQLDLIADRTSAATMKANQLRLWFASMAYVLLEALRRIGLRHTQPG
jgi:Transposase DDE domain group 1